jgi:hypothetical protein
MPSPIYKLKVLSVMEPWATLIMRYGKDVENRSWYPAHRGPLLIHASMKVDLEPDKTADGNIYQDDWEDLRYGLSSMGITGLPAKFSSLDINPGHLLGFVWLSACMKNSTSPWADKGQYHWLLSEPVPFKGSYPCRGKLGLWDILLPLSPDSEEMAAKLAPYLYKAS